MSSSEFDRPGPIMMLAARWRMALALVVVLAVLGAVAASTRPAQYTAESRLVVGDQNLSAYEIAGFATASSELASDYARYVDNSSTVTSAIQKALGSRADEVSGVSASPIPNSSVVSVEIAATSRSAATTAVNAVAAELVRLTATSPADSESGLLAAFEAVASKAQAAQRHVQELTGQLAQATRAGDSTSRLEAKLAKAKIAEASLNLQQTAAGNSYQSAVSSPPSESQLQIIQRGAVVADNRAKTYELYTVGGAVLGLLLAIVLANLPGLRRRRRVRPSRSQHAAVG